MTNASDLIRKAKPNAAPKGVSVKAPPAEAPRAGVARGGALREVILRHERAARSNIRRNPPS